MGTASSREFHLAWPDCADEPISLEVHWPSGAVSTAKVKYGATAVTLEEPLRAQIFIYDFITLGADDSGSEEACLLYGEMWTCCERCSLTQSTDEPLRIKLKGKNESALVVRSTQRRRAPLRAERDRSPASLRSTMDLLRDILCRRHGGPDAHQARRPP
jgi:hypothetical protein